MADVHSPETRSYNMSQIKGKNTKPEEKVRKYLFSHGFRYRKNVKSLPGKPDIVLPKYKTCVFVNGCFWHRHPFCKYATTPKTNAVFWQKKFEQNVANDKTNYDQLEMLGWRVIVIWECELSKKRFEETMGRLINELGSIYIEDRISE